MNFLNGVSPLMIKIGILSTSIFFILLLTLMVRNKWRSFLNFFYNNVVALGDNLETFTFVAFCIFVGVCAAVFDSFGFSEYLFYFWAFIFLISHNFVFPFIVLFVKFLTSIGIAMVQIRDVTPIVALFSFLDIVELSIMYITNKKRRFEKSFINYRTMFYFIFCFIFMQTLYIYKVNHILSEHSGGSSLRIATNISNMPFLNDIYNLLSIKTYTIEIYNFMDLIYTFKFIFGFILIRCLIMQILSMRWFMFFGFEFLKHPLSIFYYVSLIICTLFLSISFYYRNAYGSFFFFSIIVLLSCVFIFRGFEILWNSRTPAYFMLFVLGTEAIIILCFLAGFVYEIWNMIEDSE